MMKMMRMARSISDKRIGKSIIDYQLNVNGSPVFKVPVNSIEIVSHPVDFYAAIYVFDI